MALTTVILVVKAPNQKIGDHQFEVNLDWNVLNLKKHLSTAYPSKPEINEQRLIYSGHLLRDEQILKDIFKPELEEIVTVHLVCSQKCDLSASVNQGRENRSDQQTSEVHHESIVQNVNWSNMLPTNPAFPMALTPEQMVQQMAVMQQIYAQFIAQYQSQAAFNPPPQVFSQMVDTSQATVSPLPNPPVNDPPQPVAAPVVNAGPAAAGGAAAEDDDDLNNRDWLDWFYWMSRAVVLFSIVYFYSSFSRFIVVIGLAVTLYLYQTGWLFPRERNAARNNANPEPRIEANENNDADAQVLPEINGNVNNNIRNETSIETERFSGLRLFWVIVSSLFTSLIPEQVPANI